MAIARRKYLHAVRARGSRRVNTRSGALITVEAARILSFAGCTRLIRYGIVLALLLPMIHLALRAEVLAAEPPPGFSDRGVVTVYGDPTDLAWLGEDLLIATSNGWLFRLPAGTPPGAPLGTAVMILDVSDRVGIGQEQGLLGVIADPDFPVRPYIYVYYTRAESSGHCTELPAYCYNRVSRFTMGDDGLLDPDSEFPLLDTIMVGNLHNAGDLAFDTEDRLYVSTGDAGHWRNSQNLTNLNGKILRIDRDGAPAPGNPFGSADSVACNQRPPGKPEHACPEIFAYGLRNPFRIAFDPNYTEPVFYINDVGQEGWEEINLGIAGADYGWPMREGPCLTQSDKPCKPSRNLVEPIFTYAHETGCFAITGGAFVPGWSAWGSAYLGKYLFADWGCSAIQMLIPGKDGRLVADRFAIHIPAVTGLLFSADGDALYYAFEDEPGSGQVGVIWRCTTHTLPGAWPPTCMWGSHRPLAPAK